MLRTLTYSVCKNASLAFEAYNYTTKTKQKVLRPTAIAEYELGIIEFLYLSLFLFWIVYLYFVKYYGYWEERNVPHVPGVFPLGSLGSMLFGKRFWGNVLDEVYKGYKDDRFVGYFEVRSPTLLIRDPELIKLVLKKDFNHFTDHIGLQPHHKDYMSINLFTMKGDEWREMRQKMTPAYTAAKMKMMFYLVKRCSDVLREALNERTEKNNVIDVKDVSSRFAADIIASCAFGIDINSLKNEDDEFYRMARKPYKKEWLEQLKLFLIHAFPQLMVNLNWISFCDRSVAKFFTQVIRSTVEHREKNNVSRVDFLDLLIKLKQNRSILEENEEPLDLGHNPSKSHKREGLTIEEIVSETYLFFSAGHKNTSNVVMWTLYELASNWDIQDRLYWEVREALDRHGDISYQALQDMTYMDQVINETLRRYPPNSHLMRCCSENYKVPDSNLEIDKGISVIIPVYSLHHDPKYYPDPYKFDPERFSIENMKKRHPYVFLPFGEGPRICIGFRFGLMKIKSMLATVLTDYHVRLPPDSEFPPKLMSVKATRPSEPIRLLFDRRRPMTESVRTSERNNNK